MESRTIMSDHSQDIMLKLNNDRKTSAKYCDITLVVDEHKYPAHKCVLGLLSPFYDKMFSIEMKERFDNKAVIKGVTKEVFEAILEFVYTSNITLNMENVFGMIEAAHYMDLPYVKECCTEYLANEVNAENWCSIRAYGKRYEYTELVKKVDESLSEKFNEVINADNFADIEIKELKHLLGVESKDVESEQKLYEAVIGWIKDDVIEREKYVEELLNFIKFLELPLGFLKEVCANEKFIEKSPQTMKTVLRAIGAKSTSSCDTLSQCYGIKSLALIIGQFLAVDFKTIWKATNNGVQNLNLKYNHTGGSAVAGQYLYVFGGFDTVQMEAVHIQQFYFSCNFTLNSTKKKRYGSAALLMNAGIYVSGGLSVESSTEICRKSGTSFDWTLLETTVFDRHSHALVSLTDLLFVVGGSASLEKSLLVFNPSNNGVKTLQPMKCKRVGLAAVVLNGEIYAISGAVFGTPSKSVEKYHPLIDRWNFVANLNVARHRPGACVLDNQIVVVGGGSSVVEVYDEKKDLWKVVGECEELKSVFAIFSC